MAKEKTQKIENSENEKLFYYEILGIVLLILSMLAIGKMGFIGSYLMLIIKVLFGDWYFLIILLLIIYAIRCIIIHKKLKIINIRYLGIFLLFLSLILLSHFSMHKYVKEYDQNHLKITLSLYLTNFKNNTPDGIVGGGVIGAILFYISYYLLSEAGVILVSIILLFLGIVFITKLTIKDFIFKIISGIKIFLKFFKTTFAKFRETMDKYDSSYSKTKVKFKISKITNEENYKKEIEYATRNVETIKKVLNSMNVFYNDISYIVCRNITTYFIHSHYNFSYEVFRRNLKNHLMNFSLKKDEINKELLVEVNNITPVPLRIYELEEVSSDNIIIGIDDRNEFVRLDSDNNRLLVCGNNIEQISRYIDAIIVSLMHYKQNVDYYYIDLRRDSILSTSNNIEELDIILNKINDRIIKYNEAGIITIEENNLKNQKKDSYNLIVINGMDKIFDDVKLYDKLNYMLEISKGYGYFYIFTTSLVNDKYMSLFNLFNYKLFLDSESSYSKKCINSQNFNLLSKGIEGFLSYKSIVLRMTLLKLTESEEKSLKV